MENDTLFIRCAAPGTALQVLVVVQLQAALDTEPW